MKTVFTSLLALAALSGAALANDSVDLRDSDTYFGKYSTKHMSQSSAIDSNPFAVAAEGDAWLTGLYGLSKDPMEIRRWDEKNN